MSDDGSGAMMGSMGGFYGSIIGMLMAKGNYDQIAKLREDAMKMYGDVSLPTLEKLARSRINNVSMDPTYKGAQDAALQKMMGIANADGMDAQSVAKLNQAKQAAFGVQRGMEGAAEQSLARRGMMNSGAAVSAALGSAQAGADREYQGAVGAAGDASERALQALMAGGKMAQGMGQDDLHQKDLAASADDRIAEFNSGLAGQRFKEQMELANAKAGVGNQQAQDQYLSADRTQRQAAGIGQGAGTIMGSMFDDNGAPRKKKTDAAEESSWSPL